MKRRVNKNSNLWRQSYLYTAGLFFGSANKMRHHLFGYVRPRGIAGKYINKNIAYDAHVVSTTQKRLQKYLHTKKPFQDKRVLELGPGQDLGTGILFLANGANSYLAIDRFALAQPNEKFYGTLQDYIAKEYGTKLTKKASCAIKHCLGDPSTAQLPFFEYMAPQRNLELLTEDKRSKFDFITSQSVLHTIDDIDQLFQDSHAILKEGGVMCHEIDLRTMMGIFRHRDPLNILRYGQRVYKAFLSYPGAPNRLRSDWYITSAEKIGFRNVYFEPLITMKDDSLESFLPGINQNFQAKKKETLAHLTGVLYAQK